MRVITPAPRQEAKENSGEQQRLGAKTGLQRAGGEGDVEVQTTPEYLSLPELPPETKEMEHNQTKEERAWGEKDSHILTP